MHILSDGYSPVECFVEFVATGEFPETSSSAHRTNRSQASVATAGFGGLPALCNLCVRPWGEANERSAALRYRVSAWVMKSGKKLGARLAERNSSRRQKAPSSEEILLMFRQPHGPAWLSDIYRNTKASRWCGSVPTSPLRGRWGDGLPDGVVSQTVLIKIWWITPSGGQRIPRLRSKSVRRNQPISSTQQLRRLTQRHGLWRAGARLGEGLLRHSEAQWVDEGSPGMMEPTKFLFHTSSQTFGGISWASCHGVVPLVSKTTSGDC